MLNVTFDVSAATTTTLVAAESGYTIEVHGWSVMGLGDGVTTLQDSADTPRVLDAARTKDGGGKVLTATTDGWGMFATGGKALTLVTSTSARVVGQVTYRRIKTS